MDKLARATAALAAASKWTERTGLSYYETAKLFGEPLWHRIAADALMFPQDYR